MSVDTITPTSGPPPEPLRAPHTEPHRHENKARLFDSAIVRRAVIDAFMKLTPRQMSKAPVLFVVYVGSIWSTVIFLRDVGHSTASNNVFNGLVVVFVWFVVLFGNFAEALAEGRG